MAKCEVCHNDYDKAFELVAAGQRHVAQMVAARKGSIVANQHLTAPDGSVGAVTCAVERHPDHLAGQLVLDHRPVDRDSHA